MSWNHTDIMHYIFDSGVWERLTKNEIRVYIQICKHYNINAKISFPSIRTLSIETKLERSTVIRAIKTLKTEVLICVEKRRGEHKGHISNAYQIPDYLLREIENKKDTLVAEKLLGSIINSKMGGNSEQKPHILHLTNIYNNVINNKKRTSYVPNEPFSRPRDVFSGMNDAERAVLRNAGLKGLADANL